MYENIQIVCTIFSSAKEPKFPSSFKPAELPDFRRPIIEVENYQWDTEYQMGPDTFLMQHRDPHFVARIRDYRRRLFGDPCEHIELGPLGAW